LKAINQARFQELCDRYLYREGYERINRIGAQIGKEKTVKGRPDTLISQPNDRYVFVEATTQETGLFEKLTNDIEACFDEIKIGIPAEKVERIILCHNSKLSPVEEEALTVTCQQRGSLLDLFGLSRLSFGLLEKHQILAKEYLGIELDTGQILSPFDFIERYQKSAFATPLDLNFHLRKEELKAALDALETNDSLIITGPAGVGKSRFALECIEKFVNQHASYDPFCVFNKRLPFYEDLKVYFGNDGDYIILVDDANHLSQLEHVLHLLHEQRVDRHVKVILTVRDYALANVKKTARDYSAKAELGLEPLKKEEIAEIIEAEFGIRNHYYVDRICKIAKGNPRLAVMAARLAKEANTFESISDASNLYDEYFSSITDDLSELETGKLLKLGGILAFFGSLDRTTERFKEIANNFGLSEAEFWEGLERLHAAEMVDLYENQVVKISDQVLGTYLFFRAFFKLESADFSVLLSEYLGSHEYKFREAIYPVLDIFDHQFVSQRLQKHVDAKWKEANEDEAQLLPLMRVFWFLKKAETLVYLQDRIDPLPAIELDVTKLTFEPDSQGNVTDRYLGVLAEFQHAASEDFQIAFELILTYLERRPALLPQVVYLLLERFCFQVESYDRGYSAQQIVIDVLVKKSNEPHTGLLHKRLLLRIAEKYLKTQFRSHRSEGTKLLIQEFRVLPTPGLIELRKSLWKFISTAAKEPESHNFAVQLIMNYATRVHDNPVNETTSEIVKADSEVLLPFLSSTLNPSKYMDVVTMQQYLQFLTLHKVAIDKNLQKRFTNEAYRLAKILLPEWDVDFADRRTKAIVKEVSGYAYRDYIECFEVCSEIQKHLASDVQAYQLMAAIEIVLVNLAERDGVLFKKVVKYLLQTGNKLGHLYRSVIGKLCLAYSSPRYAYNLLKKYEYNLRESWLLGFLSQLRPDQISRFYLEEVYSLYRTADVRLLADFDSLEPYRAIDQDVIANAVRILFERSKLGPPATFHYLFNPNTNVFKNLKTLFANEIGLLEDVYCYQSAIDDLVNHRGVVLKLLVELDRRFLLKYLQRLYGGNGYVSEPLNGARYAALWELDYYDEVITEALEFVFEKERSDYPLSFNYVNAFFRRERDSSSEIQPPISERMQAFITDFIQKHHSHRQRMIFIFGVITECFRSERLRYLKLFLSLNQDPETFERLSIEPRSWGGTGSMVPVFEKKIKFLESILPILSTSEFLKHKLHVNNLILDWKQRIESENKKDFLGFL
jgi:hypothetical protein